MTRKPSNTTLESRTLEIEKTYKLYAANKEGTNNNIFFSFIMDKMLEIQNFILSVGCKDILINSKGLFLKKSDIFRSLCIDKINFFLSNEDKLYTLIEQNLFFDETSYHKPDISVFYEMDENIYDDFVDTNMKNPMPSIVIEVVDITDQFYITSLIEVYRKIIFNNDELLILFVDPIKKELYIMRNDIGSVERKVSGMMVYLHRVDFYKGIFYKSLTLNLEKILSKK